MRRYYLGIDWADTEHAVWGSNEAGERMVALTVPHTPAGLGEFGRWLDERRAEGIALWAAIEKPEGRVIDFLLDHGVVVYPINPKALDRARDRFRMSGAKSDPFDARVLAEFLRTDHPHLTPLVPSSPPAQELKLLTRDYQRLVRQQPVPGIHGEPVDPARHHFRLDVKAATYHGLEVRREDGGWIASIIFDV